MARRLKGGERSKLFAFVLGAVCLLSFPALSYSQEPVVPGEVPAVDIEKKDILNLSIPNSWGRVKEVYKGNTDKVIVHIQDAHCNYECQMNIGKILDRLVQDYGLTIVGMEGSSGKIKTELFSTFPEDEIRTQTADYFVRQGKLSGAEAIVISHGFEYPLKIFGIEDPQLYANNFEAFRTSFPFKNEAKGYFSRLNECLGALKSNIYNQLLLDFDAKQILFEARLMDLNAYALFLNDKLKTAGKNLNDFTAFSELVNAINIEQKLNFAVAEEERTKLLTELTNVLSEEDIRILLDKGLAYRNEEISAALYLGFVKDLAIKNKVDFAKYPNLDKYITYAKQYDNINSAQLFEEMEDVQDAIRKTFYVNEDQRKLDFLVKGLDVMQRLVDIKMINRDLKFFKENQEALKTDKYLAFIKAQASKFNLKLDIPTDIGYLDVYMPAWADFYRVAGLRDEAMINNTLNLMQENKQTIVAMVTGGFHSRALTEILKGRGISYVVITPRITDNANNRYFEILEGKKTSLESFVGQINTQR